MAEVRRTSVLLVEDDSVFRTRFQAILGADSTFDVVDAVDTLALGLQRLAEFKVDALVVDLGLPDGDGVELIRAAVRSQPSCAVMVITVFGDEEHVVASIEAGACGYFLKDASSEDFLGAMHDLFSGGSPISPMVARLVLNRMRAHVAQAGPVEDGVGLSQRETEILTLVAKGFSFGEICKLLSVTTNTVKTHINRIYRKLGVHSRGQAVHEASRLRLIEM